MSLWALKDGNKEVAAFTSVDDDEARQACVDHALDVGLAVYVLRRLALVEGVELVRIYD